tara:strand:+ start:280 stop:552 length:273 start_codon:yes stop_codon:yes gene_type:complete
MIIETMEECNMLFIEHINYIVKQEQKEKYPDKICKLNILEMAYDEFGNYHVADTTCVTFILMANSFLYRYIGDKCVIQKEDLKRVYYVIF